MNRGVEKKKNGTHTLFEIIPRDKRVQCIDEMRNHLNQERSKKTQNGDHVHDFVVIVGKESDRCSLFARTTSTT